MAKNDLPVVLGVSKDYNHRFSKQPCESITLVEGLGVDGDAHAGATVQHRSRVAADPTQPNLRQVHLIHSEFFDEARTHGYELSQGNLGENVLTARLDILGLSRHTRLHLGERAVVRVTGLRNPCQQINDFRSGLLKVAVSRPSPTSPSTASKPDTLNSARPDVCTRAFTFVAGIGPALTFVRARS